MQILESSKKLLFPLLISTETETKQKQKTKHLLLLGAANFFILSKKNEHKQMQGKKKKV